MAWRILRKNILFSVINITGLAVGFAACMLIMLFVQFERSFENWVPNAENIYNYQHLLHSEGRSTIVAASTPYVLRQSLLDNFSEIEEAARLRAQSYSVRAGEKKFIEAIAFVDDTFLQLFDFPLISGDRAAALYDNNSILFSESMARKYFGDADPLGQTVNINEQRTYKVVGVFKDLPANTHFEIDFLVKLVQSSDGFGPTFKTNWFSNNVFTYVSLKKGSDVENIRKGLPDFFNRVAGANRDFKPTDHQTPLLVNLREVHLTTGLIGGFGVKKAGDRILLYGLTGSAVLILFVACMNFVNLSTALSIRRNREIALRKVAGANRRQLVFQLYAEVIMLVGFAFVLGLSLVEVLLPWFNETLGLSLTLQFLFSLGNLPMLIAFLAFTTALSGLYASYVAASLRPAEILKAHQASGTGAAHRLRNVLVASQFAISIGLCIATSVIYAQQEFMANRDLGYAMEKRIILPYMNRPNLLPLSKQLITELKQLPSIEHVTFASRVPVSYSGSWSGVKAETAPGNGWVSLFFNYVDTSFFDTYGMTMLEGRAFSEEYRLDKYSDENGESAVHSVILNESAVKRFGFENNKAAVGELVRTGGSAAFRIIGVVKDANFLTLRDDVRQGIYMNAPSGFKHITISLQQNADMTEALADINGAWNKLVPDLAMNYQVLQDQVRGQYAGDQVRTEMMLAFSLVSIFIACLGLYAVASLSALQRTKEIALRKVHGANVWTIVGALSVPFLKVFLLANLIAYPVGYWVSQAYLTDFSFRIDLGLSHFFGGSLAVLLVAGLTIFWHIWKVATTRPVYTLKYE